MRKLLYLFMLLCVGFQMKAQTVVDIIVESPDHTTLETAVIAAGLADDLSGPGPFTVFAPTDAAFAALPAGTVDILLADPTGDLATILTYHVVGDLALSTDLTDGMIIPTLQGDEVVVTINADGVFINDAQVILADITASNGVVHVIDAVLLPPAQPSNTIMDIVTNSSDHTTLEAALVASGLNETLGAPGSFTLFAPTDAAFAALPVGTVESLLADPFGALTDVLLYHVLSGTVLSTDLADGMMAMTLEGSDVTVTINADGVFINDAQVIVADITADNGVVHVIDAVLQPQPETTTVWDVITGSPDHTTLEAAVLAAGLDGTLSGAGPLTVFAPTDAAFAA
ncbi:MAG: fasciclin domain-containing protein, partial [Flavobacteriales bacterium]